MLEIWKPFFSYVDERNPLVFTEWGEVLDVQPRNLRLIPDERPMIMFYDYEEDVYYYLKLRGALNDNGFYRPRYKHEVKINGVTEEVGAWEAYVDCSQIFKCDRETFETLVNVSTKEFEHTRCLSPFWIEQILKEFKKVIFQSPPYLSLVEVVMESDLLTYGYSAFLSEAKIQEWREYFNKTNTEISFEGNWVMKELNSTRDGEQRFNRDRYWEMIDFCYKMIREFFPEERSKFSKLLAISKFDEPKTTKKSKKHKKNKTTKKEEK